MSEELGWSRTILTGGLMTRSLIRGSLSLLVGFAVDRYGPRHLTVTSAIVMGLSSMLLSQTQILLQFVLFFGVTGAFGASGLGCGGEDSRDSPSDPGTGMAWSLVLPSLHSIGCRYSEALIWPR